MHLSGRFVPPESERTREYLRAILRPGETRRRVPLYDSPYRGHRALRERHLGAGPVRKARLVRRPPPEPVANAARAPSERSWKLSKAEDSIKERQGRLEGRIRLGRGLRSRRHALLAPTLDLLETVATRDRIEARHASPQQQKRIRKIGLIEHAKPLIEQVQQRLVLQEHLRSAAQKAFEEISNLFRLA